MKALLVEQNDKNSVPAYKALMKKHFLFMKLLSIFITQRLTIKMGLLSPEKEKFCVNSQ